MDKEVSTLSSVEAVGDNDHLVYEILSFFPTKPLLRLNTVSKRWHSIISHPQFGLRQTLRCPNPTTVSGVFLPKSPSEFQLLSLGTNPPRPPSDMPLDFLPIPADVKIIHSCRGVLLFCSSNSSKNYYVCNPTTTEFSQLPPFIGRVLSIAIVGVSLAFDPRKSYDYKVVCVHSTECSDYNHQMEIYSSETRAWRVSGSPFVAPCDLLFQNGVFWNGAVHWINCNNGVCFDVDGERVCRTPGLPESARRGAWGLKLTDFFEAGRHLYCLQMLGLDVYQFVVYEMERDCSEWTVKHRVDLRCVADVFPPSLRINLCRDDSDSFAFTLLGLVVEEDQKPSLLVHVHGHIVSFDVEDNKVKRVYELALGSYESRSRGSLQFRWLDAYPYVMSLAFP